MKRYTSENAGDTPFYEDPKGRLCLYEEVEVALREAIAAGYTQAMREVIEWCRGAAELTSSLREGAAYERVIDHFDKEPEALPPAERARRIVAAVERRMGAHFKVRDKAILESVVADIAEDAEEAGLIPRTGQ